MLPGQLRQSLRRVAQFLCRNRHDHGQSAARARSAEKAKAIVDLRWIQSVPRRARWVALRPRANSPGADQTRAEFARGRPALPNENKTSAPRLRIGSLSHAGIPSSDSSVARTVLEF